MFVRNLALCIAFGLTILACWVVFWAEDHPCKEFKTYQCIQSVCPDMVMLERPLDCWKYSVEVETVCQTCIKR